MLGALAFRHEPRNQGHPISCLRPRREIDQPSTVGWRGHLTRTHRIASEHRPPRLSRCRRTGAVERIEFPIDRPHIHRTVGPHDRGRLNQITRVVGPLDQSGFREDGTHPTIVRAKNNRAIAPHCGAGKNRAAHTHTPLHRAIRIHGIKILIKAPEIYRAVRTDGRRRLNLAPGFKLPFNGTVLRSECVQETVIRTDVNGTVDVDRRGRRDGRQRLDLPLLGTIGIDRINAAVV